MLRAFLPGHVFLLTDTLPEWSVFCQNVNETCPVSDPVNLIRVRFGDGLLIRGTYLLQADACLVGKLTFPRI